MQMAGAGRAHLALRQAVCLGIFVSEMGGQKIDVLRTVAQGRDLQVDHIEAEQKVFAEGASADFRLRDCGSTLR